MALSAKGARVTTPFHGDRQIAHPHGASRHSRILHQAHDNHACDVTLDVLAGG